jgi:hypothetical protein
MRRAVLVVGSLAVALVPSFVTDASATHASPQPDGPAADLSEEITGGNGLFMGTAVPTDFEGTRYIEHEYVASGTASSYTTEDALSGDGRWTFGTGRESAYRTRVVVRRPEKAKDFSGTVVVEWLNVSGGVDADPEWVNLRDELMRHGDTWVGVSAQLIGVEGGPVLVEAPGADSVAGKGLKTIDAERYGSLEHPGDGYSFDIFTQVARALRAGGKAMGKLEPQRVLAAGESQSAFALVTYYNGVLPLTGAFDGFFVHSRGAAGLPLVDGPEIADIVGAITGTATIFRTDQDVPVLNLQTESDVIGVLNSFEARQHDNQHFRLWEVAGSAHADTHLVGPIADQLGCSAPINAGPLHLVAKRGLRSLDAWVRTGKPPPKAPRLEVTSGASPEIGRDGDGIARGGIRTPPVDVPVDVLSGVPGPDPSTICLLLGSTIPLPPERVTELYPTRAEYRKRYRAAMDEAIEAGFVLEADRDALLEFADPSRIPD